MLPAWRSHDTVSVRIDHDDTINDARNKYQKRRVHCDDLRTVVSAR